MLRFVWFGDECIKIFMMVADQYDGIYLHLWIIRIMAHVLLRLLGPKKCLPCMLQNSNQNLLKGKFLFLVCCIFIWNYSLGHMKWIITNCLMDLTNSSMSRINSSGAGIWPHIVQTQQLREMRFMYQKYVGKSSIWYVSAWLDFGL